MTDPKDLLPCPFCGEQGKVIRPMGQRVFNRDAAGKLVPPHYGPNWFRVVCVGNSCSGVARSYATETEAISAWNRRASPPPLAPDGVGELEVVAWGEFFDSKIASVRIDQSRHCTTALVRQSDAATLLSSLASENERLKQERDEAMDSAHGWHGQCEAIAAILDLHEPECLGFAGEVRSKFEAAEARLKQAEDALRPFAEMSKYVRADDADTDAPDWSPFLPIGAYRAARAFLASQPTTPAYQTFEQWIGEQQGFSIRAEWFDGDMAWLRAAFEAGRASRSSTSQEGK